MSRQHVFERGDTVRFYLTGSLTKAGKSSRDGMVMEDLGDTYLVVRDLHSQYAYTLPAGHVWTLDGQPGAEPEVWIAWVDGGGLAVCCDRPACAPRSKWLEIPIEEPLPIPARLQWYVDEHLKTH